MNTEQYRDLALRAATNQYDRCRERADEGFFLAVFGEGRNLIATGQDGAAICRPLPMERDPWIVMCAPLNAETVASPYALARELLASRIAFVRDSGWKAGIAGTTDTPVVGPFASEKEAEAALLDALLPAEATGALNLRSRR